MSLFKYSIFLNIYKALLNLNNVELLQLGLNPLATFIELIGLLLITQTGQKNQTSLTGLIQMRYVRVHEAIAIEIWQTNGIPGKLGRFWRVQTGYDINQQVNIDWMNIPRFRSYKRH